MEPALDVFSGFFDVCFTVVAAAARVRLSALGALAHDSLFGVVEEVSCFVIFGDDEDADESPDDGYDAFDYVEPVKVC